MQLCLITWPQLCSRLALKEKQPSFIYHTISPYLGWRLRNGCSGSLKASKSVDWIVSRKKSTCFLYALLSSLSAHSTNFPETRSFVRTAGTEHQCRICPGSQIYVAMGATPKKLDARSGRRARLRLAKCAVMTCSPPEGPQMVASANRTCF